MINNTMPRKMLLGTLVTGYTSVYVPHSSFSDEDVAGKAFWVNTSLVTDTDTSTIYYTIKGLAPASDYNIEGTFYDSMVDSDMLAAKLSVDISDPSTARTKTPPTIDSIHVESQEVDVGVGDPIVTISILGDSDYVRVDKRLVNTSQWFPTYSGTPDAVSFSCGAGEYDFRVTGFITLPDGVTTDSSTPHVKTNVTVENKFNPPSPPTNLSYKVAKIMDGLERFDLQVSWDWIKGSGSNVREFVLYFVEADEYNKTQWSKASKINSGAAKSSVITGFPYNKEYRFKVEAVAWGPADQSVVPSAASSFIITESTPLDSSFTTETGIEVTYDHIKAYRDLSGTKEQTFLLDAKTGGVSIGKVDAQGHAPVTVDGSTGDVNIDGKVIAKTMYSASFVLSNLSGQDNPSIRTASKTGYGQSAQGMWMGYGDTNHKFQFDLGDSAQFIRWDGDKLVISGKVQIGTPGGNVNIGEGIQGNFVANIYKESSSQPSNPTGTSYPPSGWSTAPLTASADPIWISTAVIDSKTNIVASNSAWSTPVRFSATAGTDGVASIAAYKLASSKPSTPSSKTIPPAGWSLYAPSKTASQDVWAITAVRTGNATTIDGNWSTATKFSGDTGPQGIPGVKGTDAPTLYTWVRYADTASGSGISSSPTNKKYIGIATNKTSSLPSSNPSDYSWALIKGDKGVAGTNGTDGKTYYTWIKYADDSAGTGFSDNPTGKAYLGIASNKNSISESTNWRDYSWVKVLGEKGDTGVPGAKGADGKTYYTWVKYADTASGGGLSDNPSGKKYIGISVNQLSPTESTNPNVYTWSKFEGDQGVPGANGSDGKTLYTWIKYADTVTGSGISDSPSNKKYIGLAYNKTSSAETSNPSDYTWSLIKGEDGTNGTDGMDGTDGTRGPGFYSQPLNTFTGFSRTQAAAFFQSTFGGSPVKYDVLTQFLASNPGSGQTRQWDGSAWVSAAVTVHGDMIVDDSITADKIIAGDAFLQQIGVNVIYDNAAALSPNPEANYKMKVDLAAGSIHIR